MQGGIKNDIQVLLVYGWLVVPFTELENREGGDFREKRRHSVSGIVYPRWYLLFNITNLLAKHLIPARGCKGIRNE